MECTTLKNASEGSPSGQSNSSQLASRFSVSLLVLALGFSASASGPHQDSPAAAQASAQSDTQSDTQTYTRSESRVEAQHTTAAHPIQHPITTFRHWIEVGQASWYGLPFQGRKTANGEIYDMNQMTCAHRTLPLGSWVRVTNLKNKKTVIVRVNDRGPALEGRVIDLSYAAARLVGLSGVGRVRLVSMHQGDPELTKALLAQVQLPALIPPLNAPSGTHFADSVDTIPLP